MSYNSIYRRDLFGDRVVVITGGGSGIMNANDIARVVLKLPSQIGSVGFMTRTSSVDATWAVAYGLCRWAYAQDSSDTGHSFSEVLGNVWDSLKQTVRSLLP